MLWKGFGLDWYLQSCKTQRWSRWAVQGSWLQAGKGALSTCANGITQS